MSLERENKEDNIPEVLYALLQETRNKEMVRIKTSITNIEQKYTDYIESVLNIKRTISAELYSNMLNKMVEISDKQKLIIVNYYEDMVKQLKKEKEELIRKNKRQQQSIQQHQTQSVDHGDIYHHITCDALTNIHVTDTRNPFQTMPTFDIDSSKNIQDSVTTKLEEEYDDSSSISSEINSATENDHKMKKKRKTKKNAKCKQTYKYRKIKDKQYLRAPNRPGDTDKTWLWCNHRRGKDGTFCGVKFIRTLKDYENYAQHYCDGNGQQTKITRKLRKISPRCTYCDGSKPCTRLATIDEIKEYQKQLKQLNVVPNTYGGYKVMGAKQTISKLDERNNRNKKGKRKEVETVVQSAFEALLPQINIKDDETESVYVYTDVEEDQEDDYKANVINLGNQPLKRRFRKRKLLEVSAEEPTTKKHKRDDQNLKNLDIDELLSKAFQYKENLKWDIDGEWCRYCGARGSPDFCFSHWGAKTLCQKHGRMWRTNALDLTGFAEPMIREQVINKDACMERIYLINLIKKHKRFSIGGSYHKTNGKRRSLRHLRKEHVDSSVSESEIAKDHEIEEEESFSSGLNKNADLRHINDSDNEHFVLDTVMNTMDEEHGLLSAD